MSEPQDCDTLALTRWRPPYWQVTVDGCEAGEVTGYRISEPVTLPVEVRLSDGRVFRVRREVNMDSKPRPVYEGGKVVTFR